ncbi:MAG: hypothetical protein LRY44_03325 [Candidatus Pacebacteria bacterium]|nr:hypothetical protein [Candidatus Paceibacterota bacterium]MCD8564021.1 hypothetical protein [Candidatus Paceibacterota bacterium]
MSYTTSTFPAFLESKKIPTKFLHLLQILIVTNPMKHFFFLLDSSFDQRGKYLKKLFKKSHIQDFLASIPPAQVERYALGRYPLPLKIQMVQREDFPLEKAYRMAQNDSSYWKIILKREDALRTIQQELSKEAALQFAEKYDNADWDTCSRHTWRLLSAVLQRKDFSMPEVMEILYKKESLRLWGDILLHRKDIPLDQAIEIADGYRQNESGQRVYRKSIWKKLIQRDDLDPERVIELIKKINLPQVYRAAYARKDVRMYMRQK